MNPILLPLLRGQPPLRRGGIEKGGLEYGDDLLRRMAPSPEHPARRRADRGSPNGQYQQGLRLAEEPDRRLDRCMHEVNTLSARRRRQPVNPALAREALPRA